MCSEQTAQSNKHWQLSTIIWLRLWWNTKCNISQWHLLSCCICAILSSVAKIATFSCKHSKPEQHTGSICYANTHATHSKNWTTVDARERNTLHIFAIPFGSVDPF